MNSNKDTWRRNAQRIARLAQVRGLPVRVEETDQFYHSVVYVAYEGNIYKYTPDTLLRELAWLDEEEATDGN